MSSGIFYFKILDKYKKYYLTVWLIKLLLKIKEGGLA